MKLVHKHDLRIMSLLYTIYARKSEVRTWRKGCLFYTAGFIL